MPDTASPSFTTAPVMCNGVNVTAMMETIEAVKLTPAIAKFNFRAKNKWMGGDCNRSTIQEFTGAMQENRVGGKPFVFDNGEHPILLGQDKAPNPVEWLLHALIGCMTTTVAYHSAAQGIEIRGIESSIEGDLDLRGFLNRAFALARFKAHVKLPAAVLEEVNFKTLASGHLCSARHGGLGVSPECV